jgi:myosin heavy subunit
MKSVLPWVLVAALLAAGYFLYTGSSAKDAEIARLNQSAQELTSLRSENAQLKSAAVSQDELVRLKKDNEDLPRLRGEIRQLREQGKQLSNQIHTAQSQGSQSQQQQQQYQQQLLAENQALKNQSQQLQQVQQANAQAAAQAQLNACINNLRQIDGAKQQWALENKKTANSLPTAADLQPYIPNGFPVCPAGGSYTINNVQTAPTCTVRGHALQ